MDAKDLLLELYGRLPDLVDGAIDGLDADQLAAAVQPGSNSIGWLVWHLTRVQDHHLAELLDEDQLWATGPWAEQCGLEPDPTNTGYGHGPADVAAVRPTDASVLTAYYAAVAERTDRYLAGLGAEALDDVVDERWDPPVTLGVRLVSVADDSLQHVGQAAYLRGLLLG
jgi:uncharacterized damage-inducible protein DinB